MRQPNGMTATNGPFVEQIRPHYTQQRGRITPPRTRAEDMAKKYTVVQQHILTGRIMREVATFTDPYTAQGVAAKANARNQRIVNDVAFRKQCARESGQREIAVLLEAMMRLWRIKELM